MARYTIDFSTNASAVVREIERVNREITNVAKNGKKVSITLDTSGLKTQLNTTFAQLNREIERMQAKLSRLQIGSQPFRKTAAAMGFREGQVERGQMIAQPLRLRGQAQAFEEGSLTRLQKQLQAAQIEAAQIKPATEPWVRLQGEIARINSELQKSDRLAENIKLTNDLGALSPGSLNQLETKLTILRNRAREISPDTREWKELNKEIVKAEQGIEKQTRRPLTRGQRLGAAGGAFLYGGGLGGGAGSAIGGIAGGLMGGVPGAFTGAAIGQAVDNLGQYAAAVATTVAEVNKSRVALAGVTKDVEDYDNALAGATAASNKFLLPIADATRQFARLQASVVGAGYETETTKKVFDGIAAAIVATGGKTEDLNGALLATAQVFSKGKVSAEELRGQIGERLPGAFTVFASAIGKTPQELDDALQKGEVTLSDFIRFSEELFKRYGETAEILATAPENAGARLEVALQAAAVSFGGFFQVVGAGFQSYAADLVNFALQNENAIKTVISQFVIFAEDLYTVLSGAVEALLPVFQNFFSYIFDNFARGMNALATLAEESRRAAGGPEARAKAAVDLLYEGRPLEGHFGGRRKAYEEALRVELAYEQGAGARQQTREQRIESLRNKLFPNFRPSSFGSGIGAGTTPGGGGAGGQGKTPKEKRIPLDQLLDLESQRQLKMQASDRELRLAQLIRDAKIAGNEAEAESLSNLGGALQLRGKIAGVQEFIAQLIEKEGEIVGKSLTQEQFNNKLQDANVELHALQNDLQTAYLEMQVKENDAQKKVQEKLDEEARKRQEILDLIEDAAIAAGKIGPIDAARIQQRRGFRADIARAQENAPDLVPQLMAAQADIPEPGSVAELAKNAREEFEQLTNGTNVLKEAAYGIGDAFAQSFSSIITGAVSVKQGISDLFKNIGKMFIDMAAKMIAQWMVMKAIGLVASFFGGGAAPPMSQGGYYNSSTGLGMAGPNFGLANGGVINGSFMPITPFAKGGMVTGPTLGLVGEGRFNEAVVPLPDGRSIPVELGQGAGNNIATNITVNVSNGQAQSTMSGRGGTSLGRELDAAVKDVILRETRPGGIIYSSR